MAEARRLTESELEGVLSRAVELDRAGDDKGWDPAVVEEIAVAAGISSKAVRRAIAEIDSDRAPPESIAEPHPLRHRETSFAEARLSEEDAAFLLRLLSRLGQLGRKVDYVDGRAMWTTPDGVSVSLTPRAAETHVEAEGKIGLDVGKAGVLFVGGSVAWAIALSPILMGHPIRQLLIPILGGAAIGTVGWATYWRLKLQSLRTRVSSLSHGIAGTLELLSGRTLGPGPEQSKKPLSSGTS